MCGGVLFDLIHLISGQAKGIVPSLKQAIITRCISPVLLDKTKGQSSRASCTHSGPRGNHNANDGLWVHRQSTSKEQLGGSGREEQQGARNATSTVYALICRFLGASGWSLCERGWPRLFKRIQSRASWEKEWAKSRWMGPKETWLYHVMLTWEPPGRVSKISRKSFQGEFYGSPVFAKKRCPFWTMMPWDYWMVFLSNKCCPLQGHLSLMTCPSEPTLLQI